MGHTNSTANLELPQFIGTDKPTWLGDVNGAFSAIDAYVGTNDAAVAAAASDASSAISQASAAVNTANTANTTAGNASTAANNAIGVANTANAIAGTVDAKVGLLADLTTTDRTSIVNAINEVNAAGGVKRTDLWVNPNPGVSMAGTTINLINDEYDMLEVLFEYSAGTGTYGAAFMDKGYTFRFGTQPSSANISYFRGLTRIDDTTFALGDGNGSDGSTDNTKVVPVKIIGIKF